MLNFLLYPKRNCGLAYAGGRLDSAREARAGARLFLVTIATDTCILSRTAGVKLQERMTKNREWRSHSAICTKGKNVTFQEVYFLSN